MTPSVATYAMPKSVYGSMDSMMSDAAPVYVLATSRPSVCSIRFATQRMRVQMSVEHVKLSPMTSEEYESAICAAVPRKKFESGTPEV